ncbi:MAG: tRNA adenosine(34) deaminase TadA [Fidelibacterota bacterium]
MSVAHDEKWMKLALQEAEKGFDEGEVPVGAVVIRGGHIIGKGHNERERLRDPTAHAEILAITAAANFLGDWRLKGCTLYVTKEPCAMCAGAVINSRVQRLVFGCYDEAEGCCGSLYQICGDPRFPHRTAVKGGILKEPCGELLVDFFERRRKA